MHCGCINNLHPGYLLSELITNIFNHWFVYTQVYLLLWRWRQKDRSILPEFCHINLKFNCCCKEWNLVMADGEKILKNDPRCVQKWLRNCPKQLETMPKLLKIDLKWLRNWPEWLETCGARWWQNGKTSMYPWIRENQLWNYN